MKTEVAPACLQEQKADSNALYGMIHYSVMLKYLCGNRYNNSALTMSIGMSRSDTMQSNIIELHRYLHQGKKIVTA
jgi:hypothetical protein